MSSIIKGLTKETDVSRVTKVPPVVRSRTVDTPPKQNVYEPTAKKQDDQPSDKKPVDDSSIHLIAEKKKKPKPTSPDKWARAKAKARSKFDVYPSAYANAYASKEYKKMGGGWRMGESVENQAINYLKEKRSDILAKFNLTQILTAVNENISENKINIRRAIAGLEMGHYDHIMEISDFKKRELEYELRNEPKNNYQVSIDGRAWKVFADKAHADAVARKLNAKGKKATVHPTGASVSESDMSNDVFTLGKPVKADIDDPQDIVFEYPIYKNGKLIGQFTFSKFFGQFYGNMGGKILPDMPTKFDGSDLMVANKTFANFIKSPSGQRIIKTMKVGSIKPQGHRYPAEIAEGNPVNVWAYTGQAAGLPPDMKVSPLPIDIIGSQERYIIQKNTYDITKGKAARDLFYNTAIDKANLKTELEKLATQSKLRKDQNGQWVYDVYQPLLQHQKQALKYHLKHLEYMFGDPIKKEKVPKKTTTPDVTSEEQTPMFTPEEEQLDELKCWPGYTRVRGIPAGAPGSCKKKTKESGIMKGLKRE